MRQQIGLKIPIIVLAICFAVFLSACHGAAAYNNSNGTDSSYCTVDMQIDIDSLKTDSIDFPLIRIKPHDIKAEEGKAFAELLFGDEKIYETNLDPEMSKATLEKEILKLEQLNNDETIIDLYGASQLQSVKKLLQESIDCYKNSIQFKDEANLEAICEWTFHPQSYYAPVGSDSVDDNGNNVIMAYVEKGNISHKLWITTRDESDFKIQNIYVYPNSEYASPLDIETLYMVRNLCGDKKPSDSEVEHVMEKADDIVKSVGIGEWAITNSSIEEYKYWRNSEKPVYVINITAVPSFGGINALHVKQLETLKSTNAYAPNYYYSELLLTFSASGELIEASLTSPIDTVSVTESNEKLIELRQAMDILTNNIEQLGAMIFNANGFRPEKGYRIEVIIDKVDLGLARTRAEDSSDEFYLMPALQFCGDYIITKNGESLFSYRELFGEDYQLALINLVDGSIIN
jgi:hypothetical protein